MVEEKIKRRKIFCDTLKLQVIQIPVSATKGLWESDHASSLHSNYGCFPAIVAELSSCSRDHSPQSLNYFLSGILQKKVCWLLFYILIWMRSHPWVYTDVNIPWNVHIKFVHFMYLTTCILYLIFFNKITVQDMIPVYFFNLIYPSFTIL